MKLNLIHELNIVRAQRDANENSFESQYHKRSFYGYVVFTEIDTTINIRLLTDNGLKIL